MSNRLQRSAVQLSILIKAYGIADEADRATDVLKGVLESSDAALDAHVFITLINTWAESSQPDAIDQAAAVLRLMEEHPKCRELGIRPTTVAYCALLKCIAKSNRKDAGKKAEGILNEMEQRYQEGDEGVKPNELVFNLAIKANLQTDDLDSVDALLARMEKSGTKPSRRTYNNILEHWNAVGTVAAAEWAEQVLSHMKHMATTKSPNLSPDCYSYSIAMNTWSKSGDPSSSERMWKIYEQMLAENVEPNVVTYTTLIRHLSSSQKRELLQRADSLLTGMENSKHPDNKADHRQYAPVIKGWLSIGNADQATRVLVRSIKAYANSKNLDAKPNVVMIDMVIQGWIKNGDLVRATVLLDKMQELHDANILPEGPDERTYQTLLSAWNNSLHPKKEENMAKLNEKIAALRFGNGS